MMCYENRTTPKATDTHRKLHIPGNLVLEQKVIANFAAKDRGEEKVAEEKLLTLKHDSSRKRYPQQLCRSPSGLPDRAFSFAR
jgi:hypothetical protein